MTQDGNKGERPERHWPSTLHRLWLYGGISLAAAFLSAEAYKPWAWSQSTTGQPGTTTVAPNSTSPMDEPIRLLTEAHKAMKDVRDYSCRLIKRERIKGELQPDNDIVMKVRNQPFSVYMGWRAPRDIAGQEICYVAPRDKNTMRAKSPGILGVAGFITVDLDDPRARQNSEHSPAEAGIGKLIERFAKLWEEERRLGQTRVQIAEYEYAKRRCWRVEAIHPDKPTAPFQSQRTILYFDKENHLPIRIEVYDWPRAGRPASGELIEVYSYTDLRLNVGLRDDVFNH